MTRFGCLILICCFAPIGDSGVVCAADKKPTVQSSDESQKPTPKKKKHLFTGKVVLVQEALKKRRITTYSELKGQVALETSDGELLPIVSDWRGRAFFQDKRLRNRKVELVGYRQAGLPYVQVLMIFTFDEKGHRQYTDYWCDICSIPMYEIKPCDCCQDKIRLRFQPQALPDYLRNPSSSKKLEEKTP